jgi:hypothetical protein
VFHVVDPTPISTKALFEGLIGKKSSRGQADLAPSSVTSVSPNATSAFEPVLKGLFTLAGRSATYRALASPLVLNGEKITQVLGWKPKPLLDVELQRIMDDLPRVEEVTKG